MHNTPVGEFFCTDGTRTMRAILDVMVPTSDRLWKKRDGNNQQDAYCEGDVLVEGVWLLAMKGAYNDTTLFDSTPRLVTRSTDPCFQRPGYRFVPHMGEVADLPDPDDLEELSGRKLRMSTGKHRAKEWNRKMRK